MKIVDLIIFLLFSISLTNIIELDIFPNIFDKQFKLNDFLVFQNNITGENYLAAVYTKSKISESFIKIYNSKCDSLFEKYLKKYRYHLFSEKNNLYFYSTYLYCYNISSNNIDSLSLKRDNYFRVYFNKNNFNNKNSIVCTNDKWIDVYDISNFHIVDEINYDNFGSINISLDGRLLAIISSDIKKIAIYDLINKSIVWEYKPKKYPIKLYGINFGKINDPILYCDFAWEKDKLFLYYTSGFGNLMKFDAETGEVKLIKERFMGSGNNAGAIVNFKLADFNKDGHVDLVGPSVDHNVYCINGQDFSVIWKYNSGYENQSPVSLYDITGDGTPEVIGVSDKMKLFIIDGANGNPIEEIVLSNRKDQSIIALCDFNGNELLDLVVKSDFNKIKVFEINSVKVQKNAIIQLPNW